MEKSIKEDPDFYLYREIVAQLQQWEEIKRQRPLKASELVVQVSSDKLERIMRISSEHLHNKFTNSFELVIGKFSLQRIGKQIFIHIIDDGEGGEFNEKALEAKIQEFYAENF
jgi:hypothetical protein